MRLKTLVLAVLIVLAVPIIGEKSGLAMASDFQFINNGKNHLSFTYYPTKENQYIGWEANEGGSVRLAQWRGLFFGFAGDIRVISRDRPFGVDFDTINFRLQPLLGYAINDNQEVKFGWYHWSEHYYHDRPVGNINMLDVAYDKSALNDSPDEIHFLAADRYAYNNYPLTWMVQTYYGRIFVNGYVEPSISASLYRYNRHYQGTEDLAFNFRPAKNDSVVISVGYKFGDESIILFQPNGPYLSLSLNW